MDASIAIPAIPRMVPAITWASVGGGARPEPEAKHWRAFSAGGDGVSGPREHDDLERWCGGRALPWHRADLGFFGAHALSRCARVARMDSCGPLLATHFLLEKQVEARRSFDHLVGAAEQRQRGSEAERPGSLEVDEQLDFR